MRLNAIQTLIILLAITVGTVITRFLPPILFPHGKPLPKFLQELCTLLPPAMMGLLLVYSLRNVSFASAGQWLPECIAIAVTAGLHLWRRNSLLSIAGAPSPICCWCRWYLPDGPGYAITGSYCSGTACFYHIAARMRKRCTSPSAMTIPAGGGAKRVVITSGGEAQKLMMARALYKTPPSCCGTNPPAALDPVSEYEVYRRFSHISGGRTSV